MSYRFFLLATVIVAAGLSPLFAAAVVPPEGTYTIAVLPDTQYYSQSYPQIFLSQTQWIANNKDAHQIEYVLHLGDITDDNNTAQWTNAEMALSMLNDQVPYALVCGNHDYTTSRTTLFNSNGYFGPTSYYANQSTIDGFYEAGKTDNSYHTFNMGGQDWLVLAMEFGPREGVIHWADQILESHPDHKAIVITHSYMYYQNVRSDNLLYGPTHKGNPYNYSFPDPHDGQDMWEMMLKDNSNVVMILGGHVTKDGTGYREAFREDGTVLHEVLVNYQMDTNGGNGFMQLLEFAPDGKTVQVKSYSPYLDQYDMSPDQQYTMAIFDRPVNVDHAQGVLEDSPVLYYRLQENQATDPVINLGSTGTTNDGTYTGSGSLASDFDGSATTQVDVGTINEMSQWSITSWVRPSEISSPQTIISNDQNGWNDDVLFGLGAGGYTGETTLGHWGLSHHDDNTNTETVTESPTTANAGQWYHVSATCDGSTVRLYVDGNLVAETEKSGADLDWQSAANRIGRSFNAIDNGRPFNGTIGEVAVFDHLLSTSDVETQRLAAFQRVVAGNMTTTGTTVTSDNEDYGVLDFPQQSLPGLSFNSVNRGDYQMVIGDRTGYAREGVMLATITQNSRDGIYGSVEVGLTSFGDGVLSLAPSQVGTSDNVEININSAVAWFPFFAGWKGGHVLGDGTVLATGLDMDDAMVNPILSGGSGLYQVDLGVDANQDGMLFTVGADNNDNVTATQIAPTGDAWYVDVKNNGTAIREDAPFSFVYIPYDSENLIGGNYDGTTDSHEKSFGNFTMTKSSAGLYSLAIDGESPESGMLALTLTGTAFQDNFLSYEASGDNFLIQSRAISGLGLDDAQFYWAFISFNDPLSLNTAQIPGDANGDGRVDGSDVTILANNWQYGVTGTPDATWDMGDFNGDGKVDGSDVTILANNWQYGVESTAATVPEPSTIVLLFLMLAAGLVSAIKSRNISPFTR